jgi:glycosyltransferase involved in cell wall biosynthesis
VTAPEASKTVVSVTPLAIERDSRTLKQAASLARAGYRSIVIEGERSRLDLGELSFELRTPAVVPEAWGSKPTQDEVEGGFESEEARVAALLAQEGPVERKLRIMHDLGLRGLNRHVPRLLANWSTFKRYLRLNRGFLRSLPEADLFIVHSFQLFPAVALRRRRAPRARYAYDAHDAYFESPTTGPGGDARAELPGYFAWQRLERRCVRGASYFTTATDGVADLLEERFGRRPAVIRNCQDSRLNRPVAIGLRERLGLSGSDYLLVSIGNYRPAMGTADLEALRHLPDDVHLALVGRGYEEKRDAIVERDLGARVHLIEAVPPSEVADFVGSADVAVILYQPANRNYERMLPNRFFHALAAGLPVLYPQKSFEIAALAERYGLGIPVDPHDPDSIAAAVSRLRGDRELAGRLRAGAERARQQESWEHEERRFLALVEEVLEESSRGSRDIDSATGRPVPGSPTPISEDN